MSPVRYQPSCSASGSLPRYPNILRIRWGRAPRFHGRVRRQLDAGIIDHSRLAAPTGEIAVRGPNVFSESWGVTRGGSDPGSAARRLVSHRRHRPPRRRWLFLGARPQEEPDHLRRRKIYPAEVERVLLEHPDCQRMRRDRPARSQMDEVPVAYVIRRSECSVDAENLRRTC